MLGLLNNETTNSKYLALSGKHNLLKHMDMFKKPLEAINEIRTLGDTKHGKFSFIKSPSESDSTIIDNLHALIRHLSLLSSGSPMDESGHHHLSHVLTRIYMLIITTHNTLVTENIDKEYNHVFKNDTDVNIPFKAYTKVLLPEIVLCILEYDSVSAIAETLSDNLSLQEFQYLLYLEVIETTLNINEISINDSFLYSTYRLFYLACKCYNLKDEECINIEKKNS